MENSDNPMHTIAKLSPMHLSKRCRAKSKRSQQRCKAPAVTGWDVCRMHGARGGSKPGKANANYKHGFRTKEAIAERRETAGLLRVVRELCREVKE